MFRNNLTLKVGERRKIDYDCGLLRCSRHFNLSHLRPHPYSTFASLVCHCQRRGQLLLLPFAGYVDLLVGYGAVFYDSCPCDVRLGCVQSQTIWRTLRNNAGPWQGGPLDPLWLCTLRDAWEMQDLHGPDHIL